MKTEIVVHRLSRWSLFCLLAAVCCLAATFVALQLLIQFPKLTGEGAFQSLGFMALVYFAGLITSGCLGLASLACGIACARQRKHVLFWTIPLWLLAGAGLIALLFEAFLFVNSRFPFIPGAKQDDFGGILSIWLALATLMALASWLIEGVFRKHIRGFPWWSVPLWTTGFFAVVYVLL